VLVLFALPVSFRPGVEPAPIKRTRVYAAERSFRPQKYQMQTGFDNLLVDLL